MTGTGLALFSAMLAQAALTAALYLMLVRVRFAAAGDPTLDQARLAYDQSAWPLKARLISNSVTSQFELPVLFFIGALLAFQFDVVDEITAGLGCAFVALRLVHAVIHTGPNIVIPRFLVFLLGFLVLIVFWVYLGINVFGGEAV